MQPVIFVMRSLDSHLDFDLTLAAQQSSENPVYYIQYAHARICSIMAQAEQQGVVVKPVADVAWQALTNELEIDLIKKMAELPEELLTAAKERAPHRIAVTLWIWPVCSIHFTRTATSSARRRPSEMPGWYWSTASALCCRKFWS